MEYINIQKCITQTIKKHTNTSKNDITEILNSHIIGEYGPGVFLLIDLIDRATNTRAKELGDTQLYEYKDSLKQMRTFLYGSNVHESISNVSQFSITKLWKWWTVIGDPGEIETIETLKFWRNELGTTDISIVINFPEEGTSGKWGVRGTIVLTNTKANNLLRFLIKNGVIFW